MLYDIYALLPDLTHSLVAGGLTEEEALAFVEANPHCRSQVHRQGEPLPPWWTIVAGCVGPLGNVSMFGVVIAEGVTAEIRNMIDVLNGDEGETSWVSQKSA